MENEKISLTADQVKILISKYMGEPTTRGFWKCCFHDDKTPSLTIQRSKAGKQGFYFKCFGSCGVSGDGYDLVKRCEGLTNFNNVVITTHKILSVSNSNTGMKKETCFKCAETPQKDKKPIVDINSVESVYLELIKYSKLDHRDVLQYLNDRCLKLDVCRKMNFRFVPYPDRFKISNHFASQIPKDSLIASGMFKESDNGERIIFLFPNQLLIPWYFKGKLYGFQGRQLTEESSKKYGKYKNTPILPVLYIPPVKVSREKDLLITEGALDSVSHISFNNGRSVALPSVSVSKEKLLQIAELILHVNPPKIVFGIDNDQAGRAKKEQLGNLSIKDFLTLHFIKHGFSGHKIKEVVFFGGAKDMNQAIINMTGAK